MGSQGGYIGRIGNVIHYKLGDKFYTRSAPKKFRQTKATKAKSLEFGMASTIGKVIRHALEPIIFETDDRKMHTRLVGQIYSWLQIGRHHSASSVTQPDLKFFKFTTGNPSLSARWQIVLKKSIPSPGQLQISIPSFTPTTAFRSPASASSVACRFASVVIDVEKKEEIGRALNEISYTLDDHKVPSQKIIQEIPMPPGSLLITGLCVQYFTIRRNQKQPTTEKLFRPSEIIYAVYH